MDDKFPLIYLADDDEDDREFFTIALNGLSNKIQLVTFPNGIKLMEHLESDTNQEPAILFLDINMPMKNGFDCLAEIKNLTKWKDLPVAMYSTSNYEHDVEHSRELGAIVYIRKPFELSVLRNIIQWVLTTDWKTTHLPPGEYFIKANDW